MKKNKFIILSLRIFISLLVFIIPFFLVSVFNLYPKFDLCPCLGGCPGSKSLLSLCDCTCYHFLGKYYYPNEFPLNIVSVETIEFLSLILIILEITVAAILVLIFNRNFSKIVDKNYKKKKKLQLRP